RVIGDMERLPPAVREVVEETITITQDNTGMNLVFALSYSGRQEIVQAVRNIAQQVKLGLIDPGTIDAATFATHLDSHFLPDPDLILRTSGEQRISNFFLWQSAYSEISFIEKHWPDFKTADLDSALATYASRERRFGRVQSTPAPNELLSTL